jgi:aerotaxis receptor
MRNNQPVTQREYGIPDGVTLMSTTDVESHITYANQAFVHVSGYERDELMGQPHNLLRHPDMPPAAYADMWATLKAGQSWTGLVKNRRKNGDHYWVRANAAPLRRKGKLQGYISVRLKAQPQEVEAAAALYADWQAGRGTGWGIKKGVVVRTGFLSFLTATRTLSTAARVRLGLWPLLPLLVVLAWGAGLSGQALGAFAVGTGLLVLAGALWLERQLVAPLHLMAQQACAVAAGQFDPSVRLDRVDDIGMAFRCINQAGLNVRSLVGDVGPQADGVRTASREIAEASNDLGSRTEQAAASLEQSASAMEQMTSSVAQSAHTASEAKELASQAAVSAQAGGEVVSQLVDTMSHINASSRKISDIIGVIDGIAFQTNILALNAAVEAARAGEQGRGFAVVAGEVRNLAQRSAAAAREIKALISESVESVGAGAEQVEKSRHAMDDIVHQIHKVADLLAEINSAAQEQSHGISEVNIAVGELDRMTQQNAAMVEQASAAAGALRDQSVLLSDAVTVFK